MRLNRIRRPAAATVFGILLCAATPGCDDPQSALPVLWDAPAFALTDQDGKSFGSEALKGKPWIGMLFFTTCSGPCPMMAMRMREVQDALPDPAIRIVSFSVDPGFDTPQRMKEYATRVKATPGRWYFLTGDETQITAVTTGLKLLYEKPAATGPTSMTASTATAATQATMIDHSTKFLLIDGAGKVRGVYSSNDDADLNQLKQDAAALALEG
ncbi:MAG TPA: SCO family protein [Tepidisphaeraceae bacterium]|jgi:protein SCO1/2